jgi:hypothetical protein
MRPSHRNYNPARNTRKPALGECPPCLAGRQSPTVLPRRHLTTHTTHITHHFRRPFGIGPHQRRRVGIKPDSLTTHITHITHHFRRPFEICPYQRDGWASNRTPLPRIPRISRTISVGPLGSVLPKKTGGHQTRHLTTHTTHITHHFRRPFEICPYQRDGWASNRTPLPRIPRIPRTISVGPLGLSLPKKTGGHQTGLPYHAYHAYHAPFPSVAGHLWRQGP